MSNTIENGRNRRGRRERTRSRSTSSSSSSRRRPSRAPRSNREARSTRRETAEDAEVELSPRARRRSTGRTEPRRSTRSTESRRSIESSRTIEPTGSPAADRPRESREAEERRQRERDHISNLDRNFEVFDNPGGGDTDGEVSRQDMEQVARGEYDRTRAEERLREAGVPQDEIEEQLSGLEDTATYLVENDSVRNRIDVANDDGGEGDPDGKISRGDLDRVMLDVEAENREAQVREAERAASQPPSEQEVREAQEAVDRWREPGALQEELLQRPLSEFSGPELEALVAVNESDPQAREGIEQALLRTIDGAENLEDLPTGDAFSYLLDRHVTGREVGGTEEQLARNPTAIAQRQIDALVKDEIEASLDHRLEDRRGDDELDLSLERVSGDLEDLAITHPALVNSIQNQAEATFEEYAEEFTEVARRDDNIFQQANHAVTGAVRDGVGFLADGFRFGVDIAARVASAPTRLAGRIANTALDAGGAVAGAGLDLVGADGVADDVRRASDQVGDGLQRGADFVADQNENFTRGLGESVAGGVEGLAYAVTDPVGTVQGLGQVVRDPSLLIEGYRETAREHGVAGAAGQVTGDVLLTVFTGGGGAAARGASVAGRVGRLAGRGGRVGSTVARGASRVQTYLDDLGRAGGANRAVVGSADSGGRISRAAGSVADRLPNSVREVVARPRRGVEALLGGDDSADFAARSRRVRKQNSDIDVKVEDVRTQLGALKKEFDSLGDSLEGEALTNARREAVRELIDPESELVRYAEFFDGHASGGAPGGVGRIVSQSRAEGLEFLRKNLDSLEPDTARRLLRGLLGDGDPTGPAFITRLGSNDRLFRAFNAGDNANGGYFSRAVDSRLDSANQRRASALPQDNNANAGVVINVGERNFALVTRVAENLSFGDHALGGGWQLQLFESGAIRNRLKSVTSDAPPPSGAGLVAPGALARRTAVAASLLRRAAQAGGVGRAAVTSPVLVSEAGTIAEEESVAEPQ